MPISDLEDSTIQTYDKYAQSWASEHDDPNKLTPIVAKFKTLLPRGAVLEIGAGGGRDAALLNAAGYNYIGTDASIGMVKAARQAIPALHFEQVNVYDLGQLGRQFDGFWASAVLLHIPKHRIDQALQAIKGVIRPAGVGFISMKDGDREEFERRRKHGRQEDRLFVYWSKEEFEEVLMRNGFTVIDYRFAPMDDRTKWHYFFVRHGSIPDIYKAAGIIIVDRKVLVERSKGKEFFIHPGGKIEAGETPRQALVRELKEEFQIDVDEADLEPFGSSTAEAANQSGRTVHIDNFIVKKWQGELKPDNEVEETRWLTSKMPANLKVGSIMAHDTIPQLKAKGLID